MIAGARRAARVELRRNRGELGGLWLAMSRAGASWCVVVALGAFAACRTPIAGDEERGAAHGVTLAPDPVPAPAPAPTKDSTQRGALEELYFHEACLKRRVPWSCRPAGGIVITGAALRATLGPCVDGVRSGWWVDRYEFGGLLAEGEFVAGLAEGEHRTYFPNGALCTSAQYVHGLRHGVVRWWYESGRDGGVAQFVRGEQDGAVRTRYENGSRWMQAEYRRDKLQDDYVLWFRDGTPGFFARGIVDDLAPGFVFEWWESGAKRSVGRYSAPIREYRHTGPTLCWSSDGSVDLVLSGTYDDGDYVTALTEDEMRSLAAVEFVLPIARD